MVAEFSSVYIEQLIADESMREALRELREVYTAGPFGDGPKVEEEEL